MSSKTTLAQRVFVDALKRIAGESPRARQQRAVLIHHRESIYQRIGQLSAKRKRSKQRIRNELQQQEAAAR